jgi:hypothetical protein
MTIEKSAQFRGLFHGTHQNLGPGDLTAPDDGEDGYHFAAGSPEDAAHFGPRVYKVAPTASVWSQDMDTYGGQYPAMTEWQSTRPYRVVSEVAPAKRPRT